MKSVNQYVMKDSGVQWIGQVPKQWEVCHLKRLVTINNGSDYKHCQIEPCIYPVIGSGGIFTYASSYIYDGEVLLLGRKGTIDKPMYYNGKFWTVDTMFYAVSNDNAICKYLYYHSMLIPFARFSTSTALPSMTQTDLKNNLICLPPLSEQRAIADWLDAKCADIDAAIELQQRMIDKLKAYKTAVIHQAVTKGLDKNLKPTDLKDSGIKWLGMIPKHWNISALRYVSSLYTGNSISDEKKFYYTDPIDAIPYISTKDVDVNYQTINYNNGLYIKKNDSLFRVAPKGSVLMCIEGGSAGKKKAYTNQDVAFVNKLCCFLAGDSLFDKFLFYFLMSPSFEHNFNQYLTGIIGGVSIPVIKNIRICLPPLTEQRAIADWLDAKCADIDATIALKEQKQEKLKAYKKTIIFEYVTGKKQVANINK